MRQFYLTYSIYETASRKFILSWSHYLVLMKIDNPSERSFYEDVYFGLDYVGTLTPIGNKYTTYRIENLRASLLPISFVPVGGGIFLNRTNLYTAFDVNLFDYEASRPDEVTGGLTFTIGNFKTASNPYPTNVEATNGVYTIRLGLIWQ